MKFKKIDDKKFQCTLFPEDLEDNDMTIEDFLNNDVDKIRNILENIMRGAHDEIGVDMEGGAVSMQLMPMPNQALCITISFGTDRIKEMLEGVEKNLDEAFKDKVDIDELNNVEIKDGNTLKEEKVFVYMFESLLDVEDFAMECGKTHGLNNALYKNQKTGAFYLCIQKGRIRKDKFEAIKNIVNEFARKTGNDETWAYINEKYDVIIQSNAINRIAGYCGGKKHA